MPDCWQQWQRQRGSMAACIKKHDMARAISFVFLFLLQQLTHSAIYLYLTPILLSVAGFYFFFGLRPKHIFSIFLQALSKILCYSKTKLLCCIFSCGR